MKKSFQRVIAPRSLSLPKGRLITIFLLAAIFALSACDDSSSASSDETGTSSSSVESSDSESSSAVDKKSSGEEANEKDKSSSSFKGSEPAEVSSSSAKETKNSSDSKSSSSVKSDDSSSSNKDNSSSSVSSSSSEKQSSSSSVKQSSSSSNLVQSSSSKGNPWGTSAEWGPFNCKVNGGCLEFTDDRNNRTYKYMKFDGKKCLNFNEKGKCTDEKDTTIYAMVENLNVGKMVDGSLNQNVDNEIERYCYDNDTLICHYYGGLYQWAEMMQLPSECNTKSCADQIKPNHQGICPDGWRLLTYDDFYIILHSDGNTHGIEGLRSTFGFGGYNTTGYSLVGAGMRASPMWGGGFIQLNESAEWYYPNELIVDGEILPAVGFAYDNSQKIGSRDTFGYTKEDGYSVRCVKVGN